VPHPYAAAAYVQTLADAEGADVVDMEAWGSRLLMRPLADSLADAAGPYPRTPIAAGADLAAGLDVLRTRGLVSVVLVPDPFASPEPETLARGFEVCRPFKTHFAVDRRRGDPWPSKSHLYKIRRAQRRCEVERISLTAALEDWLRLYGELSARHAIAGPARFSADHFRALAADPAFVAFAAKVDGRIAAMGLWFARDGVAVYHLGASDADGYAAGASYAIFAAAFEHFGDAGCIDLGGAAGLVDDPNDGLARFKQGFANTLATAWLCGSVLDQAAYARLTAGRAPTAYFPAYRAGGV
jgi:hypothetical protein